MKTKDLTLIALFAALSAVGAFIKIPTPVCPITLQLLFTTLSGVLLGGKKGAAAVAVYVFTGLVGFPVFTGGGGLSYVLQPTFGYLIGFIIGAYVTGSIAHGGTPTMPRLLAGCFLGMVIIFAVGIIYYLLASRLWLAEPVEINKILVHGLFMPLPGDIFLCIFSAMLGKRLIPIINRSQPERA